MKEPYQVERYRPVSTLRRVLIVLLAVVTAGSLLMYMLGRRGEIVRTGQTLQGEVAACKNGQSEGCVGGLATVIIAPPPASAGRPP